MLSKNSPNLCRWRDELLLLFECFDFLGYKRTLVLLTEMYYNIISRKEKGLIILREMDRNAHSVFILYYHLVSVNLSMHTKVRAVVCSRRNIHRSVRGCGKKHSGARAFV